MEETKFHVITKQKKKYKCFTFFFRVLNKKLLNRGLYKLSGL